MVNRLIMIILVSFLFSCSGIRPVEKKYTQEDAWKVIDYFLNQISTDDIVQSILKESPEVYNIENQKKIAWIYTNKENNFQRYSFLFDYNRRLESFSYYPSADKFPDFNFDQLLERWKKYECKKTEKNISNEHRTKTERMVICLNGRITFTLNRYDEVEGITFLPNK